MKKAVKAIIRGTVQGVFFRQFIKENADSLGVRGFVRNLENGDVEVIAEADQEVLERFLGFIKKGTAHSHIRDVDVENRKWSGDFKEFKILRF